MGDKFIDRYGIEGEVIFVIENHPAPIPLPPRHTPMIKVGKEYICERCGVKIPKEQLKWEWEFWFSHPLCRARSD